MITKEEGFPCASFVQVGRSLNEAPHLGSEDNGAENEHSALILLKEGDRQEAISAVSLNSFDVEAADDMVGAIKMRDRIIYAMSFFFVLSIFFLWHALYEAKGREQVLQDQLDELIRKDAIMKFDEMMSRSDDTVFELDNCYFNFRATGTLGQCAEDVTRSANDWYQWGMDTLNMLLEDN